MNLIDFIINCSSESFNNCELDLSLEKSQELWNPIITQSRFKGVDYTIANISQLVKKNTKQKVINSFDHICNRLNQISEGLYIASHTKLFINFKLTDLYLYSQIKEFLNKNDVIKTKHSENI